MVDFQLITEGSGWALSSNGLLRTDDSGKTWEDITPPLTSTAAVADVFFLDGNRGWVLSTNEDTQEALGQWMLYTTKDGGRTWVPTLFPSTSDIYGAGSGITIDFVDDAHGWIIVKKPSSANFSLGVLYRTQDGGATWQTLEVPVAGSINFVDDTVGWLAGGPANEQLYRTEDGGAKWVSVAVQPPGAFSRGTAVYDIPTFFDEKTGVLPVTFTGNAEMSGFAFYLTDDGGASWRLPGPVVPSPKSIALGVRMLSDAITPNGWVEVDPQQRNQLVLARDRGRIVREVAAAGLPGGVFHLDFASAAQGWAASTVERCPDKKDCEVQSTLLSTDDQGVTWEPLSLP